MPQPASNEIREKIMLHKQSKTKEEDIAKWLIISKSTLDATHISASQAINASWETAGKIEKLRNE